MTKMLVLFLCAKDENERVAMVLGVAMIKYKGFMIRNCLN